MKIVAVVVTYNRLELLKRNIDCLRQNQPLDAIVVVDNGCTDGTSVWLDAQEGLVVVHQSNVGGAGGFCTGMEKACGMGADWIWCMDDDVFPRPDCLKHLLAEQNYPFLGILSPRRLMDGQVYTNDFCRYNLTNPFASMYVCKLAGCHVDGPLEIAGTAFEGMMVSRQLVEDIGLPNRDLFIFCDDTDYCLRAKLAGYSIRHVPTALMDKHKFFANDSWSERNRKKRWKRFYQIRNSAFLNHRYGRNIAVRYLRGFLNVAGHMAVALLTCAFSPAYRLADVSRMWTAYRDGVRERLGVINCG